MSALVGIKDIRIKAAGAGVNRRTVRPCLEFLPRLLGVGMVVACSFCASAPALFAGEKLNIFGNKARFDPGQEKKSNAGFNKSMEDSYIQAPYDGTSRTRPASRPQPRNSQLDRRLQNERDEKENWALLAPGELDNNQPKNDLPFKVQEDGAAKDASAAGANSGKSRDYTFYGLENGAGRTDASAWDAPSSSGKTGRGTDSSRDANQVSSDRGESSRSLNLNAFKSPATTTEGGSLGVHVASELNFRSLLNPDVTTSGLMVDSDPKDGNVSMRSLLSTPSSGGASGASGQDQRMDHFRNLLAPSQGQSPRYSGFSDPINRSPDLTQQPVNPVEGPSVGLQRGTLLRDALQPAATFGAPGRALFSPGSQGGVGQPSISGFSSLPSPNAPRSESFLNDLKSPSQRGTFRRP